MSYRLGTTQEAANTNGNATASADGQKPPTEPSPEDKPGLVERAKEQLTERGPLGVPYWGWGLGVGVLLWAMMRR